jgi:hypothetical protein
MTPLPVERPGVVPSDASPSQTSSELIPEHWNHVGDDLTEETDNTVQSSWQEEAHWMSFRNAVQKFALSRVRTSSTIVEEVEGDESESDEDWGTHFAASKKAKRPSLGSSSSSESSALASDLAETRMRLALAQAERDEMEFVLYQQQQQQKSTALYGKSPS